MELYLARRYFNMTPKEWDESPWWYSRALIEGLEDEGILKPAEFEEGGLSGEPNTVAKVAAARIDNDPANASLEDYAALGIDAG